MFGDIVTSGESLVQRRLSTPPLDAVFEEIDLACFSDVVGATLLRPSRARPNARGALSLRGGDRAERNSLGAK